MCRSGENKKQTKCKSDLYVGANQSLCKYRHVTFFTSITMLCGTDNISQNIFRLNVENIQWDIVSPT